MNSLNDNTVSYTEKLPDAPYELDLGSSDFTYFEGSTLLSGESEPTLISKCNFV